MSLADELKQIDHNELIRQEEHKRLEKEKEELAQYNNWVRSCLKSDLLRLRKKGELETIPISGVFNIPSFNKYIECKNNVFDPFCGFVPLAYIKYRLQQDTTKEEMISGAGSYISNKVFVTREYSRVYSRRERKQIGPSEPIVSADYVIDILKEFGFKNIRTEYLTHKAEAPLYYVYNRKAVEKVCVFSFEL